MVTEQKKKSLNPVSTAQSKLYILVLKVKSGEYYGKYRTVLRWGRRYKEAFADEIHHPWTIGHDTSSVHPVMWFWHLGKCSIHAVFCR